MIRGIRRAILLVSLVAGPSALATTTPTNIPNTMRDWAATAESRDLLVRADEALNALTYSYYSDADVWDTLRGVYKLVCVYYVNHLVEDALPEHYDAMLEMVDKTNLGRLSVWDYYNIFRTISYGSSAYGWRRIERVSDLRPGDLVVWKKLDSDPDPNWGHIFVVASVPARDYRWSGAYRIRMTDSTKNPHSEDSRCSTCTGVGAGELLLRAGSEGRVYKIAWTTKGYWQEGSFAMARPVNL